MSSKVAPAITRQTALPASAIAAPAPNNVADILLSQEATRYFVQRFFLVTFVLCAGGSVALWLFASPAFSTGCYFGMALPILTSFISFLVTEWAFEQPNAMFIMVATMSIVLRMFNLLIAFCVGYLILKLNAGGVIVGLLVAYFSYLVIEIAYVHNKGKLLGQ